MKLTEPQVEMLNLLAFSHPGQRAGFTGSELVVVGNLVEKGLASVGTQPDAFAITAKGLKEWESST